jgi:hypothetical protein
MAVPTRTIVRDVLAEVDEIDTSPVLKAAARVILKQVGHAKVKEMARRITAAYIDEMNLPLDGKIARRVALPAMDRMLDDAIAELER